MKFGTRELKTCSDCPAYVWRGETASRGDLGCRCAFGAYNEHHGGDKQIPPSCPIRVQREEIKELKACAKREPVAEVAMEAWKAIRLARMWLTSTNNLKQSTTNALMELNKVRDDPSRIFVQREPVAEGGVANCIADLRGLSGRGTDSGAIADLLERTEAARLAAENKCERVKQFLTRRGHRFINEIVTLRGELTDAKGKVYDLEAKLTAERARSEKLVEAVAAYRQAPHGLEAGDAYRAMTAAHDAYQPSEGASDGA